jgi:hypothetical protein
MDITHLSRTISKNLYSKHSVFSCGILLHKFIQNYPYQQNKSKYNMLITPKEYNQYNYCTIPIYKDAHVETKLIEWKYGAKSPFRDNVPKNCIMVVLNGPIKERRYHYYNDELYFNYERQLHPQETYLIDNIYYRTSFFIDREIHKYSKDNIDDKSNDRDTTLTLHVSPNENYFTNH